MNREIKFRVWDWRQWLNNESIKDNSLDFDFQNSGFVLSSNGLGKKYVLQQYTGLKDKNEKEIYEGDIVQLGWDTSDVKWSALKAQVVWWHNGFYFEVNGGALAQDTYYQFQKCEVLGNIFEDQHLLKNREWPKEKYIKEGKEEIEAKNAKNKNEKKRKTFVPNVNSVERKLGMVISAITAE